MPEWLFPRRAHPPPAAMPMGEEVVAWGGTDFTLLGFIADFVRLCLFGESNMRERVEGGDTFRGVNKKCHGVWAQFFLSLSAAAPVQRGVIVLPFY